MCRQESPCYEKALGAETLAYLIEVDTELQRVASISDHLIHNLSLFLKKDDLLREGATCKQVQDLKQAALRVRIEFLFFNHHFRCILKTFKLTVCNSTVEILLLSKSVSVLVTEQKPWHFYLSLLTNNMGTHLYLATLNKFIE